MDRKSGNQIVRTKFIRVEIHSTGRAEQVTNLSFGHPWSVEEAMLVHGALLITYSEAMLISGASKQISCAIFFYIFDL